MKKKPWAWPWVPKSLQRGIKKLFRSADKLEFINIMKVEIKNG
ncbi:hypothetical protein PZE06_20010 [Robertmurraya sp. DFI.2.37]|nr:hypothetical protein [Robertmurraya sp. DFI.2.37]MDF1510422.1 hypothetical protein [Robertmurraya sp. DFI.2.37]